MVGGEIGKKDWVWIVKGLCVLIRSLGAVTGFEWQISNEIYA